MNEPESLSLVFDEGSQEEGPVTCLSPGLYRLGWTPFVAAFEDIEVYFGDVIEAEPTANGCHRFVRVAERGAFVHDSWVVGPAFLESDYFDDFTTALQGAEGVWEVLIDGWLLTHIPIGSSFDVGEELFRRRVRALESGVVDALPTADES